MKFRITHAFRIEKNTIFAASKRRDGRAVECGGLENRWGSHLRGFESLSLRWYCLISHWKTDLWDFFIPKKMHQKCTESAQSVQNVALFVCRKRFECRCWPYQSCRPTQHIEHLTQEFSDSRNDKLNDKLNDELSDVLKRNMFEGPNRTLLFLEVRVHHFLSRLVRHCYVWFHSVVILVTCECHH